MSEAEGRNHAYLNIFALQCTGVVCALRGGGEAAATLQAGRDGVMGIASCGGNYSTTKEDRGCFSSGRHTAEGIFHLLVLSEMEEHYK